MFRAQAADDFLRHSRVMDQFVADARLSPPVRVWSRPLALRSDRITPRRGRRPGTVIGMRITYRVFLVGCIPITIAAAIALAALVLLNEADRARNGALLAGTIYRNLLAARTARDDFLETKPAQRA